MTGEESKKKHCESVVDCHGSAQNCWAMHDVPSRDKDNNLLTCCPYTYSIVSKIAKKKKERKIVLFWAFQESGGYLIVSNNLSKKEIDKLIFEEDSKDKEYLIKQVKKEDEKIGWKDF